MNAFVLVDYDNLPDQVRRSGLVALASRVDANAQGVVADLDDTYIRLYGGWYDAAGLTNAGTLLTQEIGTSFPILHAPATGKLRRIYCEMASSLIDSRGDVFLFTMRRRQGIRSALRSMRPNGCVSPTSCTIDAVVSWSSGACPLTGCPLTPHHAFTYTEQKLTDTLLCADLLALAQRDPPPPTFVVSNDDDMTPAILLAVKTGAPISQIRSSTRPSFYDGMLRQNNIQVLVL